MPEWRTAVLSTVLFCSSECDTWPLHQDLFVLITVYARRTEDGVTVRQLEAERRFQLQTGFKAVTLVVLTDVFLGSWSQNTSSQYSFSCVWAPVYMLTTKPHARGGSHSLMHSYLEEKNVDVLLYFTKSPSRFTMWVSNVLTADSHILSKTALGLKHRRNTDICKQMLLWQQLETIRSVGFSPILTPIT